MYVTECVYQDRVQKFDSHGSFVLTWGTTGGEDGELDSPNGICMGTRETVFVADTSNHRIQKFTTGGVYILDWGYKGTDEGTFDQPTDVAVDDEGNVYVVDSKNHRIQTYLPVRYVLP